MQIDEFISASRRPTQFRGGNLAVKCSRSFRPLKQTPVLQHMWENED